MNRRVFAKWAAGSGVISLVGGQTALAEATATPTDGLNSRLFGNAHDLVPTGTGDGVEIVSIGGFSRESVQVVIRNSTDEVIYIEDIDGAARNNKGELMMVRESAGFVVNRKVEAGDIAIGSVYFGAGNLIDPEWEYEFEVIYNDSESGRIDLRVTEVVLNSGLDGFIENPTDETVEGPISVLALFFNEDGGIQGYASAYASKSSLESGESSTFSAIYYSDLGDMTDKFLVGAVGWSW